MSTGSETPAAGFPAEEMVINTNVCIVILVESHLGELLDSILCAAVLAMLVSDWLFYSTDEIKRLSLTLRNPTTEQTHTQTLTRD